MMILTYPLSSIRRDAVVFRAFYWSRRLLPFKSVVVMAELLVSSEIRPPSLYLPNEPVQHTLHDIFYTIKAPIPNTATGADL
jgi:hypothetical protein